DQKEIGIVANLKQREYGAYMATVPPGKYEGIVWGALDPVPRSRQLPRERLPAGESAQHHEGERPAAHRHAPAPAAGTGSREAARPDLRDPALSRQDGVSRRSLLRPRAGGLGSGAQELRSEYLVRLWPPPPGGPAAAPGGGV